ncbi:hypothetical protein B0T10DRAFT_455955 [Thelonectria olida]|uniref:Uncharacterized protein n=1 Tax=Thelonectria olida TaxID=1576542 RepID=A0A9P8WEN3_9HYPO|nr:hypothetical protein B0T10DRAFT_455955 [Thelonectria olida]
MLTLAAKSTSATPLSTHSPLKAPMRDPNTPEPPSNEEWSDGRSPTLFPAEGGFCPSLPCREIARHELYLPNQSSLDDREYSEGERTKELTWRGGGRGVPRLYFACLVRHKMARSFTNGNATTKKARRTNSTRSATANADAHFGAEPYRRQWASPLKWLGYISPACRKKTPGMTMADFARLLGNTLAHTTTEANSSNNKTTASPM